MRQGIYMDYISPVIPPPKDVAKQIRESLKEVGEMAHEKIIEKVIDWNHTPDFTVKVRKTPFGYEVVIATKDKIFGYVTGGTKPHIIRPVDAKALRFIASGEVVFAKEVHHPGTEPQRILEQVLEEIEDDVKDILQFCLEDCFK